MTSDPLISKAALKVVMDCNVFLQALVNPNGPAGMCMQLIDSGEVELFVSEEVVAEVAGVLARPRIRELAPGLTVEMIETYIAEIRLKSICLQNVPEEYHFERDPKDERYINLAIAAGASYIVSRDDDLLNLMSSKSEAALEF